MILRDDITKRFLRPSELLEAAAQLYGVANGHHRRSMIDAVRDVYFARHSGANSCGDIAWRIALDSLTQATDPTLFGGFQSWEHQDGRTDEECRKAFQIAIPIAERMYRQLEAA